MKDLTVKQVTALTKPGAYRVSKNLYVQVADTGAKSWTFRYMKDGAARWMGLGPLDLVSLAEARDKALACRKQLLEGVDPIEAKRAQRQQAKIAAGRAMTFMDCGAAYIATHEHGWRNGKHRQQWRSTLETYVYPVIGDLSVSEVDTALVMKIIQPIWTKKPETASRVRGRIESVLGWATVSGYRTGDNPARWSGHLAELLPAKAKVRAVKHHNRLPYDELGAFVADLRQREGIAARALEFAILTATRTGEVIGARWSEIDIDDKRVWVIPPERTKARKEHRIPLSDRAVEILEALPREGDFVFIGARGGKSLSNMAMLKLLKRMGRSDLTAHGFRSTFSDWCAEQTAYPSEVREMALAHAVGDKVEAAYRRGDLFEKRRKLMTAWAGYCASPPRATGEVVSLAQQR